MRTFSNRPDVLLELVGQIFRNKQNYLFKMNELKKCLEKGKYLSFGTTYHFVEKNWHRSIGNAIQTLQEIGYEIIHENRSYAYISKHNKDFYEIAKAIHCKKLIKFDYKRKKVLDELDFEKQQDLIKNKSYEEAMQIMYNYENEKDIVVSPYEIISGQLLCGKKSGKDSEKTYDFFVYDIDRMQNIHIEKTSNNKRYYSLEKAVAKLPSSFSIDLETYSATEQIFRKNIALYKTYEISYCVNDLVNKLRKKFGKVDFFEKENSMRYYARFNYYNEDTVFNYIRKINTEERDIKFKKSQQQRYENWLAQEKLDKKLFREDRLLEQEEKQKRRELRIQQKERKKQARKKLIEVLNMIIEKKTNEKKD